MTKLAETPMSVEEFLLWQEGQDVPHELVSGRRKAMTGGSVAHGDIIGNVFTSLRSRLSGKPCKARMEVAVATPRGNVRYPDVLVDCGASAPEANLAAGPTVVIEVTSPGSHSADFLQKPRDYASIPTISTYVILNQDARRAAVLRRSGTDLVFEGEAVGADGIVELPEIDVRLPLSEVYEGLALKD